MQVGTEQIVGPYRLESVLGQGGMGVVHLAYDQRLHRRVAIKHLRPERNQDDVSGERFRREARAAAALSHPVIIQVFDLLEREDGDWIVMEYVEGQSLAQRLSTGAPLDLREAVEIALNVLDGLDYAHREGFIHRDLKTENVMLSDRGSVKILDLGLAKRRSGNESTLTAEGALVGTCRAMSPEQALGLDLDARSDLFSFGVLLYEMVTATSPFQADNATATLARICTGVHTPLLEIDSGIPQVFSRLVDHLLAKLPAERPDAEHIRAQLESSVRPLETDGLAQTTTQHSLSRTATFGPTADPPLRGRRAKVLSLKRISVLISAFALIGVTGTWLLRQPSFDPMTLGTSASMLPPQEAQERHRRGMELLARFDRAGNIDRAASLFRSLVAEAPDMAPAHAGLSRALWRKARQTKDRQFRLEAIRVAEKAVDLDPYLASGHVSLGLAQLEVDPDQALTSLETALRLDPSSADAYRGLALLHENNEEPEAAIAAYQRAIEIWPEDRELQDLLGILYYTRQDFDDAARHFERSIELAPDSVFGYINLAGVHFMQEDYDAAASLLQKALELQPQADVYTNLGSLYFFQGRYEDSIGPFRKAVETEEGQVDPLMWMNLGDAYRWTPGYDQETRLAYGRSIELIRQRIVEVPGTNTILRSLLTLSLARRGDWEEALREAALLEQQEALEANIEYNLALAYEQCGERKLALAALRRALQQGLPFGVIEREQEFDRLRNGPGFNALREQS